MCRADLRDDLGRLDRPTVILHGDADAAAPLALTGVPTAALVPHATLEVLAGAPHGAPLTMRARIVERIAAFARR